MIHVARIGITSIIVATATTTTTTTTTTAMSVAAAVAVVIAATIATVFMSIKLYRHNFDDIIVLMNIAITMAIANKDFLLF